MKSYVRYQNLLLILLAFVAGSLVSIATTAVLAHGGDASKLHSCVDDTTGAMRLVGVNDTCPSGEHNVDWDQESNHGLPFTCAFCTLTPHAAKFAGKDFSDAQLRQSDMSNSNLTGVIFTRAKLDRVAFDNSDLTNADLSDLIFESNLVFASADLTNANLSNNTLSSSDFTNANVENTDFSNVNFSSTNFLGATNMDTASLSGVTWDSVTCPDGTNSDENSNTCVGHLTP